MLNMWMRCIDASVDGLSVGRDYEVISTFFHINQVSVIDDYGVFNVYDTKRFVPVPEEVINYKFNESEICNELKDYIDSTYGEHYAQGSNDLQTLEEIGKEPLRGFHFCQSNVIKYASRCEHKGTTRTDLIKAAHYSLLAIYHFDQMKLEK